MSEERLDRIEALAEKILEGLKETKQRTDSNARAIEALTAQASEDRKQAEKDRKGIYLLLGQLTRSMSDFYQIQSDFYNRFDKIDSRQADITRILQELKGDDDEENKS